MTTLQGYYTNYGFKPFRDMQRRPVKIIQSRKGRSMPKLTNTVLSAFRKKAYSRKKNYSRKKVYSRKKNYSRKSLLIPLLLSQVMGRKSNINRRKKIYQRRNQNFSNRKGILIPLLLAKMMGRRNSRYSRKGDLDSDFLGEFGNIDVIEKPRDRPKKSFWSKMTSGLANLFNKKDLQKLAKDVSTGTVKTLLRPPTKKDIVKQISRETGLSENATRNLVDRTPLANLRTLV